MEHKTNTDDENRVPDVAPKWDELHDRAPYTSDVRDDPTGGVVVHRCHPDGDAKDYFAFAMRYETMKGYVDKNVYLFDGPVSDGEGPPVRTGSDEWNHAIDYCHFREGSHEDCSVCQDEADPDELIQEVIDGATQQVGGEHNVATSSVYGGSDRKEYTSRGVVHLDSHGMATSGPYDVDNSTRHWEGSIEQHPYVHMCGAEEVGEGGNAHSPDNTLKITLKTWYPNSIPGVKL